MPRIPTEFFSSWETASPYYRASPRTPRNVDFDALEYSPTNGATCRKCKQKIYRGMKRVGKRAIFDRPPFNHYLQYYHDECFPDKDTLSLPGGRTAEDELEHHNKEAREKEKILRERAKLREMLRKVRLLYAQRLGYSDRVYCVFHNTTLDDLTIKMPKNRSEMMNVYGMGPKRFQNIGEALLLVIRKYVRDGERAKNLASPGQEIRTNANDGPGADGSSDEEVVMGETWTVEDIVNRKFAEAEAMGLMIMLDDDD